jgi:hypothetical protein
MREPRHERNPKVLVEALLEPLGRGHRQELLTHRKSI